MSPQCQEPLALQGRLGGGLFGEVYVTQRASVALLCKICSASRSLEATPRGCSCAWPPSCGCYVAWPFRSPSSNLKTEPRRGYGRVLAAKLPRHGGPVPPQPILRDEFLRACRLSAGLRSDWFWVSELKSALHWVQCLLAATVLLHLEQCAVHCHIKWFLNVFNGSYIGSFDLRWHAERHTLQDALQRSRYQKNNYHGTNMTK